MNRLDCDRMFVAVLEAGSFAAAAARLGTSPGQASKLVSRLEASLGVQLLHRTTRSVAPTEAGRAYFAGIRALLDEYDTLDQSVRDATGQPRGRLRISAPQTFGKLKLLPALIEFAKQYPEIALDVNFTDRQVHLVDEGYDAAIRITNPADSSLIARKLGEVRLILTASPDYLARHGTPQTPADLARHHCIIDTNIREPELWRFQQDGQPLNMRVSGRLRFSNVEACMRAAEAGLGVAYLVDFIAHKSIEEGRLQTVLSEFERRPFGVHVLHPAGRHPATPLRVLVDFLVNHYQKLRQIPPAAV